MDSRSPLPRAHAHNDYWHSRPLHDALTHGFISIEADVFLLDGELFVGHDWKEVTPLRTLRSLYLDPLSDIIKENSGLVIPGYRGTVLLWVDIKTHSECTYRVLHEQLLQYKDILTAFEAGTVKWGRVTVIISGNRPRALMEQQGVRYAACDGRLSDLRAGVPATFMPFVSEDWKMHFSWVGRGPMPEEERKRLQSIVDMVHSNGRKVRFWGMPDCEPIWDELIKANVDLISADDLFRLARFLQRKDGS